MVSAHQETATTIDWLHKERSDVLRRHTLILKLLPFSFLGDVMKDFLSHIKSNSEIKDKIDTLRGEVESFARGFPMPGFDNH